MEQNVLSKGRLGGMYRVWGDGKQMVDGDIFDCFGFTSTYSAEELREMGYIIWAFPIYPKNAFLSEGDTPCFLHLINDTWATDDLYPFMKDIMEDFAERLRWSMESVHNK